MKYFVRILLSIVGAIFGFGFAILLLFGVCYGTTQNRGFCDGGGQWLTSMTIPVLAFIATWVLVMLIQKSTKHTSVNTTPSIAPNFSEKECSACNIDDSHMYHHCGLFPIC